MLVYITRPNNHEVAMGGWRDVKLWTDKPDYQHWPVRGRKSRPDSDEKAIYTDVGWTCRSNLYCRAKPLVDQNASLEENAWKLIFWSCIPKEANIKVEDALEWGNTLLDGEDINDEFHRTNRCTLLHHIGGKTEHKSNVHSKRFLMEVNIVTTECKIITPSVHFFDGNKTVITQEIDEYYSNRYKYACPEMDTDIPL